MRCGDLGVPRRYARLADEPSDEQTRDGVEQREAADPTCSECRPAAGEPGTADVGGAPFEARTEHAAQRNGRGERVGSMVPRICHDRRRPRALARFDRYVKKPQFDGETAEGRATELVAGHAACSSCCNAGNAETLRRGSVRGALAGAALLCIRWTRHSASDIFSAKARVLERIHVAGHDNQTHMAQRRLPRSG